MVLDLEDSVAPAAKAPARDQVVSALRGHEFAGKLKTVRVNACDTAWCYEDIIVVTEGAGDRVDPPKSHGVAVTRAILGGLHHAYGRAA